MASMRPMSARTAAELAALDHVHVWHPFTFMRQWREEAPLIVERADGFELVDIEGRRYLDGVSSLWCNVHGHRVPSIDAAIRAQLDRVAHSTLLGLANVPSIELAVALAARAPAGLGKVFYSDAGATAVEVAFKMAAGHWFHRGRPEKCRFIGLAGAYHGDTAGAMSVGYSELFHQPFRSMVFPVDWFPAVDALRPPAGWRGPRPQDAPRGVWPSEWEELTLPLRDASLAALAALLGRQAGATAAVCVEPLMQGAAGMVCQPPGFLAGVENLCRAHDVLLVADEVATGFARTGSLFAVEQEGVRPDLLCLAKGISGGYLPLAATLATDAIEASFQGEYAQRRTLFHGHTYTGNPLACAAGLASLALLDDAFLAQARAAATAVARALDPLRTHPQVLDVRQRGLMVGIELGRRRPDGSAAPFDFGRRTGHALCRALRADGAIIRPLGDVLVLMPAPAMPAALAADLAGRVVRAIERFDFGA